MSLEVFLVKGGSETYYIAAACQLLKWANSVAYINNHKEKEKKYAEIQEEVDVLVEKYKVSAEDLFGADCELDGQSLDHEELMERADKLVAREEGWN